MARRYLTAYPLLKVRTYLDAPTSALMKFIIQKIYKYNMVDDA